MLLWRLSERGVVLLQEWANDPQCQNLLQNFIKNAIKLMFMEHYEVPVIAMFFKEHVGELLCMRNEEGPRLLEVRSERLVKLLRQACSSAAAWVAPCRCLKVDQVTVCLRSVLRTELSNAACSPIERSIWRLRMSSTLPGQCWLKGGASDSGMSSGQYTTRLSRTSS